VPWVPVIGEIEVNVGPWTANITALVVPNGVLTVTFLVGVSEAVTGMVKVAVTVVGFTATKLLTVMAPPAPAPPETFTAVAPPRFVPVRVTGTLVPRKPVAGAIEVT